MRICIHPFSGEEVLKMLQKSVLNPTEDATETGSGISWGCQILE